MFEVASVFLRLFFLIYVKFIQAICRSIQSSIGSFLNCGVEWIKSSNACFYHLIGFVNRSLGFQCLPVFCPTKRLGVVILTRLPIAEQAAVSAKEHGASDQLQDALRHPALFERILVELTSNCVVQWLTEHLSSSWSAPHLYLVHRQTYTSAFNLNGWLAILPNHWKAKEWYDSRPASVTSIQSSSERSACASPNPSRERSASILSMAQLNINHRASWEDPSTYSSSRMFDERSDNRLAQKAFAPPGTITPTMKRSHTTSVQYVTVPGLGFSELLEVGLRAALRSKADYVIVLNPRALGIRPDHLTTTMKLLTGESALYGQESTDSIDIVLGITVPYFQSTMSKIAVSKTPTSPIFFMDTRPSRSVFASPTGLYLLGIRGGRALMLQAQTLTASVEWCSSAVASRLWANLTRLTQPWTVVCLRERLEELMQPPDLLALETKLSIPSTQFLRNLISVIIPMGLGHPDDSIDPEEDADLVFIHNSRALDSTLDLMVHNASGNIPIEIIIIHSGSSPHQPSPINPAESFQFGKTRLRSMITVSLHYYTEFNGSDPADLPPRRGELIDWAVTRLAKGSTLVFVEPGIQLPLNWDSAVSHSLQRPGVGMGCFAYRLHLHEKYINRKSVKWAVNSWLANYLVNVQTRRSELPIVGQPCFIYTHYLACLGGYPKSSRALHSIDLAIACHSQLGRVIVTRSHTASAGVPAAFALRHGTIRTAIYCVSIALARYFGTSEAELDRMLTVHWWKRRAHGAESGRALRQALPLVEPCYLDGY